MYFFIISNKTLTANKEKIRLFFKKKDKKNNKSIPLPVGRSEGSGAEGSIFTVFFFLCLLKNYFCCYLLR